MIQALPLFQKVQTIIVWFRTLLSLYTIQMLYKGNWRPPKIIVIASSFGLQLYLTSAAILFIRDNLIPQTPERDNLIPCIQLPVSAHRQKWERFYLHGNAFIKMGT